MPVALNDIYSEMKISRQRRYQLRQRAQGHCAWCGNVSKSLRCDECKEKKRKAEKAKRKTGQKNSA